MDRLTRQRREGFDAPAELASIRSMTGEAIKRYPLHPGVEISHQQIADVRCLVLTPQLSKARLLYFHGGGFRLGSPEISAGFVSRLAFNTNCECVIPFYCLAPEHPFPAALLEGQAVLEALPNDKPLLIGGDSAGGNLAAVLGRRFAERVLGILLLSPWLDLRIEAESYTTNAELDQVFSSKSASDARALYLQGEAPTDPDVSPLLGNLENMPTVLLAVGAEEVLLDDSTSYADQLRAAQREVDLHVIPGMCHVEPTLKPDSPHTANVLKLAADFIGNLMSD